jgi:hypothetical protein
VREPLDHDRYLALKRQRFKVDRHARFAFIEAGVDILITALAAGSDTGPVSAVAALALIPCLYYLARIGWVFPRYFMEKHRQGYKWAAWGDIRRDRAPLSGPGDRPAPTTLQSR